MTRTLLRPAVLLAVLGVLSRVLGVVRDRLLTSTFGAGIETDAFLAANRVPDLLYQLLIVGAVSSVFIPVYTSVRAKSEEESDWLAANVLVATTLVLAAAAAVAALFAPALARILAGGFPEEGIALTVRLMRIQLLAPVLLGASSICSSLLQTKGTFWTFAVAPLLYNLGQIAAIVFLGTRYGIAGASWGVAIGAAAHLAIQLPSYLRRQPVHRPRRPHRDPHLRRMLRQAGPRILALAGSQVNLLVETALASLLAAGSITYLTYGQNGMSVPLGAIGLPVAIAAFPMLSKFAADADHEGYRRGLVTGARRILFWTLPAAAGLLLLRHELVTTLFLSDRFTAEDARMTANVLAVFSLALVTQALIPLFARASYAQHDTRTPVVAALVSIGVNVALSLLFVLGLGWNVTSLALAFTIGSTLNLILNLRGIARYAGAGWGTGLRHSTVRTLVGTGVMAAIVVSMNRALIDIQGAPASWSAHAIRLILCGAFGAAVYLAAMWAVDREGMREVVRRG